jgi:hypothetical protein
MKSDQHTSKNRKPQSGKYGDERPPDKVRDAAWTVIKKMRKDDPTLVPAVLDGGDDGKGDGRSKVLLAEQGGKHVAEATSKFTKELIKSGFAPPHVKLADMGSDSSQVRKLNAAPQSSSAAANKVHAATKNYIKELRESGFEPPKVTLVEKGSGSLGKRNDHGVEQAGGPTLDEIHAAAGTFIKVVKQSDPKQHETSTVTLAERGCKTSQSKGTSECSSEAPKTMTPSSPLPPRDSPLTTIFAGQYVSSLMLEEIRYLKLSYEGLSQEMSIPEMVLRDAIKGKMVLTRGQWVRLGQRLSLPTTYQLRPAERDGAPCWEVCYPPVRVPMDKA